MRRPTNSSALAARHASVTSAGAAWCASVTTKSAGASTGTPSSQCGLLPTRPYSTAEKEGRGEVVAAAAAVQPACFGRTVVADGVAEEDGLLANEAHALAQPPDVVLGERPPREEDGAVRGVVEALQQLDDRRLACEARRREREGRERARGGRVDAMRSHGSGLRSANSPQPLGPTSATFWPGRMTSERPRSTGTCGRLGYAKWTPRNSMGPGSCRLSSAAGRSPDSEAESMSGLRSMRWKTARLSGGGVMWQGPLSGSNAPLT